MEPHERDDVPARSRVSSETEQGRVGCCERRRQARVDGRHTTTTPVSLYLSPSLPPFLSFYSPLLLLLLSPLDSSFLLAPAFNLLSPTPSDDFYTREPASHPYTRFSLVLLLLLSLAVLSLSLSLSSREENRREPRRARKMPVIRRDLNYAARAIRIDRGSERRANSNRRGASPAAESC